MTKLLTRDAILGASDIKTEDVKVPEWGGVVRVRGLTAGERDAFEASMVSIRGQRVDPNFLNVRARLVMASVVNEDGQQMFTQSDIKKLSEKSASAMDRIYDVAQRLSGLSAEDIQELEGKSEAGQSDDSPSG